MAPIQPPIKGWGTEVEIREDSHGQPVIWMNAAAPQWAIEEATREAKARRARIIGWTTFSPKVIQRGTVRRPPLPASKPAPAVLRSEAMRIRRMLGRP